MEIVPGCLYFVSDAFFEKISDPYLKCNYESTKRPHYFAFRDEQTKLLWLVPCSSKIVKFEQLILKKQAQHKPTDTIKIIKIFDRKTALLFQDMFPCAEKYLAGQYIKGNQPVRITNPDLILSLKKTARKVIRLLRRGIRFTPTQPDVLRIEGLMLQELTM